MRILISLSLTKLCLSLSLILHSRSIYFTKLINCFLFSLKREVLKPPNELRKQMDIFSGTGNMPQIVRCLPHKHWNPSWGSRAQIKSHAWRRRSSRYSWNQAVHQILLASQPSRVSEHWAQWETLPQVQWEVIREDFQHWLLISTNTSTCRHPQPPMHVQTKEHRGRDRENETNTERILVNEFCPLFIM